MIRRFSSRLGAAMVLLFAGAGAVLAQDAPPRVSVTEGHLLAYFTEGDGSPVAVGTLQHFSLWKYGSNFFFVDISGGPDLELTDTDVGVYLEYAPVFSLQRLGVLPTMDGPLRDVGVTAQVNGGWTPGGFPIDRVFLGGIELAWDVPGFNVFNTQLLSRHERGYHGSWQATWVYDVPLQLGVLSGEIAGFLDVWRRTGQGEPSTVVVAQPQVRFNVGTPEPGQSFLQLGIEFEPSHDFPARGVRSGWNLGVSPMIRWVF